MNPVIILITDDDEDDRYFLRQAIARKITQAVTLEARNGEEALQSLSEDSVIKKIDLILLDMNMPGMSGLDVLDSIRNNSALEHTPVVMISTSSEPDLVAFAYSKGVNSYIKKPINLTDYNQIAEALKVCFLDSVLATKFSPHRDHAVK